MQIVEKASAEINQIFEIINVVYDQTELSFDPIDTVITNFNKALSLAANIDSVGIKKELLAEISDSVDIKDVINRTLYEFAEVLNWKSDKIEIFKIKESQIKDLIQYFEKLLHLNIAYTSLKKDELTRIFMNIGLRLLKVRYDLVKILEELKRLQEIKQEIDKLTIGKAAEYNLTLTPEKTNEFIYVLLKLYEYNFFQPIDPEIPLTESNVLIAFENFLNNEMMETDWYNAEIFEQFNDIMPSSNKKASLPHFEGTPRELRRELNAFFMNLPFDDFLNYFKDEFKTEKGKNIAILIYVLKNNDPVLLEIPYGKMKKFYTLLKSLFNTDIGTYQSIANYSVNKTVNQTEINSIKDRLANILLL